MASHLTVTEETHSQEGGAEAATCPYHHSAPALLDLADPHFHDTSLELFASLRAQCPVARITFQRESDEAEPRRGPFFGPAYLVTPYDESTAALLDERIGVDPQRAMTPEQLAQLPEPPARARIFQRNLLGVDPPDHARLRKLVQPSFTNRQMEAFRPRIQAIVDHFLDQAEAAAAARGETAPNRTMDLVSAFAFPVPIQVICELLGIPAEDQDDVKRWFHELPIGGGAIKSEEEIETTFREFVAYLETLFERRRQAPTGDLISDLVHAEEAGDRLDGEELLSMVFILLAAGHVTTVNLIASGTLALLTHPSELAKVRANPELMKNAVEEILRYWGPLDTTLPRFATENMVIGGVEIPRGETILVGLSSSNHDPQRFAQPEVFDITREDANRHIAFGKGIHVCLGAPLARMEGDIALTTLLARYPELRLAVPAGEIRWKPGFLRALEALPLAF
ncbi:MAG: cytochrome P450 [Thermomicrobiales bacterium]